MTTATTGRKTASAIWNFPLQGKLGFNTAFRFPAMGSAYQGWEPDIDTEFAALVADGITTLRECLEWRFIETSKGVFDWSAMDLLLSKAVTYGIDYVACLFSTPTWASPAVDYTSPPADVQDYADFVTAFVDRYGPAGTGAVEYIELWNEPWGWFGYKPEPDPASYAELARAGAEAAKAADPDIKCILVADPWLADSLGGVPDEEFFSQVATADPDLHEVIDVVSVHPYTNPLQYGPYGGASATQQFDRTIDTRDQVQTWAGRKVPVWITECGWTNATLNVGRGVTETVSAGYYKDAIEHVFRDWVETPTRSGVERVYVHVFWRAYNTDLTNSEAHFAVLRNDGTEKPAYATLTRYTTAAPGEEPPPAAFVDPTDLTGLMYWFDADQLSEADTADITALTDFSGNANHFTQATGTKRATMRTADLNGHDVAEFTGSTTSDEYTGPDLMAGKAAGEVFIVLKGDADPAVNEGNSGLWRFGTASVNDHHPYTDGAIYNGFGSNARKTVGDVTPALTSWRLFNVRSAAGAWSAHVDGTEVHSTATNTVAWHATPVIGRSPQASTVFYDGRIAEIVLYDRVLTGDERDDVEAYIAAKYGLTIA